jgi:hypothetical protein
VLQTDVSHDRDLGSTLKPIVAVGGGSFSTRCLHAARASHVVAVALLFFLSAFFLRAQGTLDYVVLQTGGGQPLVSDQQLLQTAGVPTQALFFDFGFFTDEIPMPGAFLDSFTVTIQDGSSATAVLVTADASGVLWSPFSPGAVFLSDSDIVRTAIIPPSLQPILGQGVAFSVRVPLPAQFTGPTVTVYFDLFDNVDQIMSLGWYYDPHITSIPEPQSGWLFALGVGLLLVTVRRRQSNEVVRV